MAGYPLSLTMRKTLMSNNTSSTNFIKHWSHLAELPSGSNDSAVAKTLKTPTGDSLAKDSNHRDSAIVVPGLRAMTIKLIIEVLTFMFCSIRVHIKRLSISVREFEVAKNEACQAGYVLESAAGKTKHLIPTLKAFADFDFDCPYASTEFIEHSYYIGNTCFLLQKDPQLKSVRPEVPIGTSGSTCDVVTITKSGIMAAYEITLSTGNLMANAAKYKNTAFASIVFLCRDDRIRQAVKASLRESGLPAELLARFEYTHFSALVKRQRKLSLY